MNGTFMETYLYDSDFSEYNVTFGRNFNLLDKLDAKIYLPCENPQAKAGFIDGDDGAKFIDFNAKYSNGCLVFDTKDISVYELQDIFVGTDEEIAEYIKAYNEEGGYDGDEDESSQESNEKESASEVSEIKESNKSSVNTGDSSNIVVIMLAVLTAVCVIVFMPIVRKSK